LWPRAKTSISLAKRLLRGAVDVGLGDSIQNARWVAWRTNETLNRYAMDLAHFIERRGALALPLSNGTMVDPDWTNQGIFGELSHRHLAAESGLGVIGVPTYCITPQYGPRQYFITILTELELEPDPKIEGWNPCDECNSECIEACPADAIERGRRTIMKGKCIPYAMPHGVRTAQDFLHGILETEAPAERRQALYDFDFARIHRATVYGVGIIAGCFHCLEACPVGKNSKFEIQNSKFP
jgi:epoxyqueuosine reductase QueG